MSILQSRHLYSLLVHTSTHSTEDIILNKDLFAPIGIEEGDYIQICDPDRTTNGRIILRVPALQITGGTLEISLSKTIAESLVLKPFQRVIVEKIDPETVGVDFVELAFRRQFLQRGNMWRFKKSMKGRPVHVGQSISIDGVQAQIQELGCNGTKIVSGIIKDRCNIIFRSRSARIFWLIQISAEMWEYDQNGDLYFEKFLNKFVEPLFDRWKSLNVSHSLTVVFFARTLYLDRVDSMFAPELASKGSLRQRKDGIWYQDFYKVVLENAADIDIVTQLKILKKEFWAFPENVGWNIPSVNGNNSRNLIVNLKKDRSNSIKNSDINKKISKSKNNNRNNDDGNNENEDNSIAQNLSNLGILPSFIETTGTYETYHQSLPTSVPSDAINGNFLEAINTTLNLIDKHFMDRDLLRTGNSIVMITAGTGVYKVDPLLSVITKQRMMDNGIGLDLVSLSQPPLHSVPLFHVDCFELGLNDFYETPHWVNVSYVDCQNDGSVTVENSGADDKENINNNNLIKPNSSNEIRKDHRWSGLNDFKYGYDISNYSLNSTTVVSPSLSTTGKSNSNSSYGSYSLGSGQGDGNWGKNFMPLPFFGILSGFLKYNETNNSITHSSHPGLRYAYSLPMPLISLLTNSFGTILDEKDKNEDKSNDLNVYKSTSPLPQSNQYIPKWGDIPFDTSLESNYIHRGIRSDSEIDWNHDYDLPILPSISRSHSNGSLINNRFNLVTNRLKGIGSLGFDNTTNIKDNLNLIDKSSNESSNHDGFMKDNQEYEYYGDNEFGSSNHKTRAQSEDIKDVCTGSFQDNSMRFFNVNDKLKLQGHRSVSSSPIDNKLLTNSLKFKQQQSLSFDRNGNNGSNNSIENNIYIKSNVKNTRSMTLDIDNVLINMIGSDEVNLELNQLMDNYDNDLFSMSSKKNNCLVESQASPIVETNNTRSSISKFNENDMKFIAPLEKSLSSKINKEKDRNSKLSNNLNSNNKEIDLINADNSNISNNFQSKNKNYDTIVKNRSNSFGLSCPSSWTKDSPFINNSNAGSKDENCGFVSGLMSNSNMFPNQTSNISSSQVIISNSQYSVKKSRAFSSKINQIGPQSRSNLSREVNEINGREHSNSINNNNNNNTQNINVSNFKNNSIANIKANTSAKPVTSKEDELRIFIQKYMNRNKCNPFIREEGTLFIQKRTHNRLRWSHVFPSARLEHNKHYGLNWKSLCQPAILPLTTSHLVSVNTLKDEYHIQGYYDLIMDPHVCAFKTPENLLDEMICQRLSQEYQLVQFEGNFIDSGEAYKKYIMANGYNTNKDKVSLDKEMIILTMGHRVQFLCYDRSSRQVRVTRYCYAGRNNNQSEVTSKSYAYSYEQWVPQRHKYQTMTASFQQFLTPEYSWNTADEILLGNLDIDTNTDYVKAKRLRFAILPQNIIKKEEMETYFAMIDKLLQHISKSCQSGDIMKDVEKNRTFGKQLQITTIENHLPSSPTTTATKNNKNRKIQPVSLINKIWLQGPNHVNPKWAYFKYDSIVGVNNAFHIEMHWTTCDSWLMDEFVTVLFRRCTTWGLRMAQIPEFFCTANLQVHPFRAQPYIPVPSKIYLAPIIPSPSNISSTLPSNLINKWQSPVELVENLFFRQGQGWIEDNERFTNWEELGLPIPDYSNKAGTGHNFKYNVKNSPTPNKAIRPLSALSNSLGSSNNNNGIADIKPNDFIRRLQRTRNSTDRQYIHRKGFACVRVGAQGFIWLLNSSARVSTTEAISINKEAAIRKLHELNMFCTAVGCCYDILIEIFEDAILQSSSNDNKLIHVEDNGIISTFFDVEKSGGGELDKEEENIIDERNEIINNNNNNNNKDDDEEEDNNINSNSIISLNLAESFNSDNNNNNNNIESIQLDVSSPSNSSVNDTNTEASTIVSNSSGIPLSEKDVSSSWIGHTVANNEKDKFKRPLI
jgi:hypothetical protein